MNKYTRRDFLKMGGVLGAGLTGFALAGSSANDASTEQAAESAI